MGQISGKEKQPALSEIFRSVALGFAGCAGMHFVFQPVGESILFLREMDGVVADLSSQPLAEAYDQIASEYNLHGFHACAVYGDGPSVDFDSHYDAHRTLRHKANEAYYDLLNPAWRNGKEAPQDLIPNGPKVEAYRYYLRHLSYQAYHSTFSFKSYDRDLIYTSTEAQWGDVKLCATGLFFVPVDPGSGPG